MKQPFAHEARARAQFIATTNVPGSAAWPRIDRFVGVHCREGRDWMITPTDPDRFVAAIQDA